MSRYAANLFTLSIALLGLKSGGQLLAQEVPRTVPVMATTKSQGTMSIGGETYTLSHAAAYEAKVFDDFMIHVIASSEPIAVDKLNAALREGKGTDDKFSTFQPHIKLAFKKSGEVSFCNAYAKGNSFSASGGGHTGEATVKDNRVVGKAARKADEGKRDETTFDIGFDLALIAVAVVVDDKPAKKGKSRVSTNEGPKLAKGKTPAEGFNAYDLPIPQNATDIEFKKLVEHIHYKSPSDVKIVTDFLIKQFDSQQWSKEDEDLTAPKSSILKRTKGGSSLTVFVKPDDKGSSVIMLARGLSWEQKKSTTQADPRTSKNAVPAASGILVEKFPVPDKATEIERDADVGMVSCRSKQSARELVEFYRKNLTKLSWQESKGETVLVEAVETGLISFTQGNDSIRISIQDGMPKSRTRVIVPGSGLKATAAADE